MGPPPLRGLEKLYLSNNSFDGIFSTHLGRMYTKTNGIGSDHMDCGLLKIIDARHNYLTGIIPTSIGLCTQLQVLALNHNRIAGKLPDTLGLMKSLQELRLENNHIAGSIPTSMEQLSLLRILLLQQNDLTGGISSNIGKIGSQLKILTLDGNPLGGTLPLSLLQLSGISVLSISNAGIGGNLEHLDLQGGKQIGVCLSFLRILNLDHNSLTGKLPTSIGLLLTNTESHRIPSHISSAIKPAVGLVELHLSHNAFLGPLPVEYGQIGQQWAPSQAHRLRFELCDLSHNQLTGSIPLSWGNLEGLQYLYLNNNHLTNNLPLSFSQLLYLKTLDLSSNLFNGTIPSYMGIQPHPEGPSSKGQISYGCCMSGLRELYLSNNQFSGTVPSSLCSIPYLTALMLDNQRHRNSKSPIPARLMTLTDRDSYLISEGGPEQEDPLHKHRDENKGIEVNAPLTVYSKSTLICYADCLADLDAFVASRHRHRRQSLLGADTSTDIDSDIVYKQQLSPLPLLKSSNNHAIPFSSTARSDLAVLITEAVGPCSQCKHLGFPVHIGDEY